MVTGLSRTAYGRNTFACFSGASLSDKARTIVAWTKAPKNDAYVDGKSEMDSLLIEARIEEVEKDKKKNSER